MRSSLIVAIILMGLGLLGALINIYLGFGLSKEMAAASDQHLTIALTSLFLTVAGGIGSIRFSKIYLQSLEIEALRPEASSQTATSSPLEKLKKLQDLKHQATTLVMTSFVILMMSMISGTISQSGRFPWVHGVLGLGLSLTLISAIQKWIRLLRL